MELRIERQTRGVRIITGDQARERRKLLNQLIDIADEFGFSEITLPSLEPSQIYVDKAGPEILSQMYIFPDKKQRALCLRPEATATIQLIADKYFARKKDVRLWYFERCWRYEKPQEGRYREFLQFGMEVINPSSDNVVAELIEIAERMIALRTRNYVVQTAVKRGLDYYTADGFEISIPSLGAQKQVLGGGRYRQGVGFAIGFDRLMLCPSSAEGQFEKQEAE
ncbi:MAG: ATP phosphoribosyltransferase regulatory subunit [Pseudomonadales bacterium]|nr:ATP phosphoribosyltransferase regulatory subunit [Pseudomonadales bacterium]